VRKLLERLLCDGISDIKLNPAQAGFRAGRSTLEQMATLDQIAKHCMVNGLYISMLFLDIQAAFDTVDRNVLWSVCLAKGVSERWIRFFSKLIASNRF
jgi:hypothetical protein